MSRIISCVGPDVLSVLLKSDSVSNLKMFCNLDMPSTLFDEIWSDNDTFDLAIIANSEIDIEDLSVAVRNCPDTHFIIYGLMGAFALKSANLTFVNSLDDLSVILKRHAATTLSS